jgi:hypothetical protein
VAVAPDRGHGLPGKNIAIRTGRKHLAKNHLGIAPDLLSDREAR